MLKDLFSIKRKQLPWVLLVVFSGLAAFFVAQFSVAIASAAVLSALGKSPDEIEAYYGSESYWPKVLIYLLIYIFMVYLVFQIMRFWDRLSRRGKSSADSSVHKTKKNITQQALLKQSIHYFKLDRLPTVRQVGEVLLYYVLYMITMLFVGVFLQLTNIVNVDQTQELGVSPPGTTSSILAVAIIFVVLPPICEEILFRGYLYHKLREYAPLGLSVLLTSILFGIAHLEYGNLNWIAAVDTFVFSLYLIFVSQKHKSLYSAILLHTLKNTLALTLFISGVQATAALR